MRSTKVRGRSRRRGPIRTVSSTITKANAASIWRAAWLASTMTVLGIAFLWAYWPTLAKLVAVWNREPDYSHGFLVAPLAVFFLWVRKDRFPGTVGKLAWAGLLVIGLSIAVRALAAYIYLDALDGWSIMLWLAGVAWFYGGWRLARWAMPSIAFLFFLVPLPFRVETSLSYPLQRVATRLSCWILQCFGLPALAEGNTVLLGDIHLEVEQACSGLRIFVGVFALAFALLILLRRTWWEKAIVLLSVVPVALVANASRIVATGLFYRWMSGEGAQHFAHDFAGWVMIPYAFALLALVVWYLGKLYPTVEMIDVGSRWKDRHQAAIAESRPV